MEKIFIRFTAVAILILFITLKPLFVWVTLSLFLPENLYFLSFIIKYFKIKQNGFYCRFEVNELKFGSGLIDMWWKINEIRAFKRMYLLFIKNNKVGLYKIITLFLIILAGIPIKFLKFSWVLITSKDDLYVTLAKITYTEFDDIKNKKIEIMHKKVFLNCSTRKDVLKILHKYNSYSTPKDMLLHYRKLIKTHIEVTENRPESFSKTEEFKLSVLTTEEGYKIKKGHWSTESRLKLNGESIKSVTHATSNVSKNLTNSQRSSIAMVDLIKQGSSSPGSVVSLGDFKIKVLQQDIKFIPRWQLCYTHYFIWGKDYSSEFNNAFTDYEHILADIIGAPDVNADVKSFVSNKHNLVLIVDSTISDEFIIEDIKNLF